MSVAIVDYGSGNLHSAAKAFARAARDAGGEIVVTADPDRVARADRVVLPGVGAFADCRAGLDAVDGMVEAIEDAVRARGRPFLGICVGAQLMATRGLEKSITPGLGWIEGDVALIGPDDASLPVPHMGWHTLNVPASGVPDTVIHPLLDGIETGPEGWHAYFVHSYHVAAGRPDQVLATADYGGPVTAIVAEGNAVGTQFHPEKSQALGLRLIANFLRWTP